MLEYWEDVVIKLAEKDKREAALQAAKSKAAIELAEALIAWHDLSVYASFETSHKIGAKYNDAVMAYRRVRR